MSSRPVVLDTVSRRYREGSSARVVLDRVSGSIDSGEIVALTGPSGSGKSTLLGLLGGMDVADEGRVLVAGHDLGAMDETERTRFRRRQLGIVFQQFNLIPTLDLRENLLLRAALDGDPRRDADAADAMLDAVGLADRSRARPTQLSGGEQQRVAFAAALVHRPALILADEPTGNLDRGNAERVLALFTDLVRQHGATLLMATHDQEVAAAADRRWVLHDGQLEDG